MKRRVFCVLLAVFLVISISVPAFAASSDPTVDVPVSLKLSQATGIDLNIRLDPQFVKSAQIVNPASCISDASCVGNQNGDKYKVAIASAVPVTYDGVLFYLRLTLKKQAGSQDELWKLLQIKVNERITWQADNCIILSGVKDGGAYDAPVTIGFNEGTATLNGSTFANGAKVSAPGNYTLKVTDRNGKVRSINFVMNTPAPTGISITKAPNKRTYVQGEAFDGSGMELMVFYQYLEPKVISSGWTASYDFSQPGEKTVTISYGGKTASLTVTVKSRVPDQITSATYKISNGYARKIKAGTTAQALNSGLNERAYIKIYNGNSEVSGSTIVGTGMVVKLLDGNTVKATATIIVTGDTNGDGKTTITDMLAVKAHILKKNTLSGAYAQAADPSADNNISITDFIQIKASILGKGTITAN